MSSEIWRRNSFQNKKNQSIFHLRLYTFAIFHGSFCNPSANHEVDLLLRYRLSDEIKAALVSYLFPALAWSRICFLFSSS